MKRFDWYATFTWGVLTGIAVTISTSLMVTGPLFKVDPICREPSLYCFVYTWQTLLSGGFALAAGLLAWAAVRSQTSASIWLTLEMKKDRLLGELTSFNEAMTDIEYADSVNDFVLGFCQQFRGAQVEGNIDVSAFLENISRRAVGNLDVWATTLKEGKARAAFGRAASHQAKVNTARDSLRDALELPPSHPHRQVSQKNMETIEAAKQLQEALRLCRMALRKLIKLRTDELNLTNKQIEKC